jgi:DNA modification methylase
MKRRVHQTQKPDDVMAGILSVFDAGQSIIDPFAGSGSTGRAAVGLGLHFTGIEMLLTFCDLARDRIAAADAGGGPLFAQK